MSHGITYLHSHSGIERQLKETAGDKFHVLIDEEYLDRFESVTRDITPFRYMGKTYYKVPTMAFVICHGIFKNLER